jgi:hypothetical protein
MAPFSFALAAASELNAESQVRRSPSFKIPPNETAAVCESGWPVWPFCSILMPYVPSYTAALLRPFITPVVAQLGIFVERRRVTSLLSSQSKPALLQMMYGVRDSSAWLPCYRRAILKSSSDTAIPWQKFGTPSHVIQESDCHTPRMHKSRSIFGSWFFFVFVK